MQPGDSMIDSASAGHGVLSKNSLEHLQDFRPTDRPLFNQTDHHPDIIGEVFWWRPESGRRSPLWWDGPSRASAAILCLGPVGGWSGRFS